MHLAVVTRSGPATGRRAALAVLGALAAAPLLPQGPGVAEKPGARPAPATARAAPGYVADQTCAPCHRALYESYREVAMARSFYRPSADNLIEDFDHNHFYHPPSDRHYEMIRRDGRFFQRRYQVDERGEEINVLEREIDWIMGSGSHARSYLYQTAWGELYLLPLTWYSQTGEWGMAPGYDRPDHQGFNRLANRDCMFCHNAYPDVPAGSDTFDQPQVFPSDLPEGIGCQRCHGPGEDHVRAAFDPGTPEALIRSSITNPGRLDPRRRDDVCLQCHMQPSVMVTGVRHFDRSDYSFRPGQDLADYIVALDVVEERDRGERFEVNHHAYRLRQSRCYQASDGALSCLDCHDPHRKVPVVERPAHYRAACLRCHSPDDCDLDAMAGDSAVAADDCAACHMSERRPQDTVRVLMTDHLIRRRPGGSELTAPLAEREYRFKSVELLDPERAPKGPLAEVYRAVGMVRVGIEQALDALRDALAAAEPEALQPFFDLAIGQLQAERWAEAEETLLGILERRPGDPTADLHLAVARAGLGKLEAAGEHFLAALDAYPENPELRFNYGRLLARQGRPRAALEQYEAALRLRPNLATAHLHAGDVEAQLARPAAALARYRQALTHNPGDRDAILRIGAAHFELANALGIEGRLEEAVPHYERAADHEPASAPAFLGGATALALLGRFAEAVGFLSEGSERHPDDAAITHALARLLAAAPAAEARDGGRALGLVQQLLGFEARPEYRETLAMALAEVGRFDEAAAVQRDLVAQARAEGAAEIASRLTANLDRYERREKCASPW